MRSDPTKIPDNTAADSDSAEVIRKSVTIPTEPDKAGDGGDRSTKNDRELDVVAAFKVTDSETKPIVTRKAIEIDSEPEGESS